MRRTLAVVAVLAATGCSSESELRYTSTLQAETNGVALSDDGLDGHAAMSGTTCTIDTNWGCPTSDADLPTEEESLQDHYLGQTLGSSSSGLHVISDGVWMQSLDVPEVALRSARFFDAGTVMIHGDATACFVQHVGAASTDIPGAVCADDVEVSVDRNDGTLFAATIDGVYRIDAAGASLLASAGDLVDWDPMLEVLYTANSGSVELSALRIDGSVAWQVETAGAIRDLHTRGRRGEVLVLIDRDNGLGALERRSGDDGRLLGRSTLPDDEGEVVTSDNGITVAIVRPDEVNFFSLETDEGDEPTVIDDTPPVCIDPSNRVSRD